MATTKTIDSLVEDIYNLFTSDTEIKIKQKDLDQFAESVVSSVVSSLTEVRDNKERNLRISMIGHPDRKIWYSVNGEKDSIADLSAPTLIKFLYGHILESLLIFLCQTAGHEVKEEQKQVEIAGVTGHHDAIVDNVLVDFKSASSFSFKKFKSGDVASNDPFGYIAQLSAYRKASGLDKAGFIAIDKSSGEICYCPIHPMEFINPETRINEIKKFLEKSTPPKKCYDAIADGKSGNMRLAVGCTFCDYKHDCWKDANNGKGIRTFMYANGPKDFVVVNREPDVQEIHG
ncbi:MAG: hypothetical protein VW518_00745 [Burkholderiaceae bacterium]